MYKISVKVDERRILSERCALPSFEQWLKNRQ